MRYQTNAPFGIRVLKAFCLLFCFSSLLGLIPGTYFVGAVQAEVLVHVSHRMTWIVTLVNTFLFGAMFYGLQRRVAIAWKLGWAFLVVFFSQAVISGLNFTLALRGSDR
jgi:hypothetical protein